MFNPATLHPDFIRVGPGHYRMGLVHFEHLSEVKEACAACNGTGRDQTNKRKHCLRCRNRKVQTPAENCAIREGYSFSLIGNARDLRDAVNSVVGPLSLSPNYRTKPAHFVYDICVVEE